ncbi:hypothetical protein PVAP13_8NG149100 [Panicum virgatum]|uniref:Uncharacterized protein n=1 Tax=Panicum virgatum TaxID=38727 RepID=A0A8T0P7R8_PANVG|nr:hypothetical protein PVAP13_8NG149100 [Panicum virgatum]KAG2558218.1 hypothetical protein PVAP13_8NG149100 [Panicum virgatum]KAG2558219.1 hypothetical protein PVAP13_8NG149100 [Panicum virgatum]
MGSFFFNAVLTEMSVMGSSSRSSDINLGKSGRRNTSPLGWRFILILTMMITPVIRSALQQANWRTICISRITTEKQSSSFWSPHYYVGNLELPFSEHHVPYIAMGIIVNMHL